jgi:universal stress protein E
MKSFNRILVATDFSPAAQLAVTRAGQLASQHGAELHVIHATPDWNLFSRWTSAKQQHYEQITLYAQSALRDEVNRILSTFGVHAHGEVQLGKASEVIARVTASYEPNMVIVGARGEHNPPVAPAALGGTTLKLILRGACPLLLVRNEDTSAYRTSLAAIHEASELSRRLTLWGTSLVPGGGCHIVHAYEAPYIERIHSCGIGAGEADTCVEAAQAVARKSLDELLRAVALESRVHLHLAHGNPLGVLVTEIARYAPQLVIIGRHETPSGHGSHESFGDMGLRMAYHTPVDVLVVP